MRIKVKFHQNMSLKLSDYRLRTVMLALMGQTNNGFAQSQLSTWPELGKFKFNAISTTQ